MQSSLLDSKSLCINRVNSSTKAQTLKELILNHYDPTVQRRQRIHVRSGDLKAESPGCSSTEQSVPRVHQALGLTAQHNEDWGGGKSITTTSGQMHEAK